MGTSLAVSALRLLGLARRAGAVAVGIEAVRRSVEAGEARLVLTAEDASSVQLEKVWKAMRDRAIPRAILGDRDALGAAVGAASASAVAVTNDSFADRLLEELSRSGARVEKKILEA